MIAFDDGSRGRLCAIYIFAENAAYLVSPPHIIGGQSLQGAFMNSVLEQQVDALSRLASTIRTGLTQSELAVPPINELLAELAEMGVCDCEYEGPAVYCRPAGRSSDYDDLFIIYSAALTLPGGIGAAL